MRLSDSELWRYIQEDIPYFDLTTYILPIENRAGTLKIKTRQKIVMACSEEASRIGELIGCEIVDAIPSGQIVEPNSTLITFKGDAKKLHQVWKLAQVLLENACGMATKAKEMCEIVKSANQKCEVLVTRKNQPFLKRFAMRALVCGGVLPHRLGLSETVLIFEQHRALFKSQRDFKNSIAKIKEKCVENKLVIESDSFEDAKKMLQLGADVIQMDKVEPKILGQLVEYKENNFPNAKITAAGGINIQNAKNYAKTGIDAIITSSLYYVKPADLTSLLLHQ